MFSYEIHYDKRLKLDAYHSDLLFALVYNRNVHLTIYLLKNYKKAASFSYWNHETLKSLDIAINYQLFIMIVSGYLKKNR
jgi:hypothetical protein